MGETVTRTIDVEALEKARLAAEALDDLKGKEIVILDLTHLSTFSDFFVIVTGDSHVHMKSMADRARQAISRHGLRINHAEGHESKTWILLDFNNVIVHIFSPSARNYYGLEQLWGDAQRIPLYPGPV